MITEEIAEQPQSTEALAQALEQTSRVPLPERMGRALRNVFSGVERRSAVALSTGLLTIALMTSACGPSSNRASAFQAENGSVQATLTDEQREEALVIKEANMYIQYLMDNNLPLPANRDPYALAAAYRVLSEQWFAEAKAQATQAAAQENDYAQPTKTVESLRPDDTLSETTRDVNRLAPNVGIWTYNIQSGDTVSALLEKANAVVNGQTNVYESRTMGLPQNIAIAIRVGDELVILSNLDEYQQKGAPVIYAGDIALIVDIGQENWQSDLQTYCDQNALTLTK